VAQRAALAALLGNQECVEEMRGIYDARRRYLINRLRRIPGMSCLNPEATFYAYPNITGLFDRNIGGHIKSSMDLGKLFLEKLQIGIVPGTAFGTEGYIRLSYACDMEKIEEGMNRIENLVNHYR
jgi:aspartate aminotransferase